MNKTLVEKELVLRIVDGGRGASFRLTDTGRALAIRIIEVGTYRASQFPPSCFVRCVAFCTVFRKHPARILLA